MGKGVVITPDMKVSVQEFPKPLFESVGAVVGGIVQEVRPKGLPRPYLMAVNDAGLLMKLPFNPIGSFWYGTQNHGSPIVGNVVLLKEGLDEEYEPDWFMLDDGDIKKLMAEIAKAKASRLPEEPKGPPPPARVIPIPDGADIDKVLAALGFEPY
ncbi:MAG: DUF3846 domain-containing protein [Oscillibacter sp.]|nr:DUF3846 domain-containing protein [Oscillibacter sp.]